MLIIISLTGTASRTKPFPTVEPKYWHIDCHFSPVELIAAAIDSLKITARSLSKEVAHEGAVYFSGLLKGVLVP
jgi:hypothetical protein